MIQLNFVTGNINKAKLLQKAIGFDVTHSHIDLTEIQSLDLEEIIVHKVKEAYSKLNSPVIVHDTALYFNALGHLPGPFIKWFLDSLGNNGLCKILDGFDDRSAYATVMLAFYDGKDIKIFQEKILGEIAKSPKGEKGFGWDPVFIPTGYDKTRAQLDESHYEKNSLTKILAEKMGEFLKSKY